MELEKALRLKELRTDQIEVAAELPSPEDSDTEESPVERFRNLGREFARYVPHFEDSGRYLYTRISPMLTVSRTDGVLPEVRVRLSYQYVSPENRLEHGLLEFNEFNEGITAIEVQWIHAPSDYFGNPDSLTNQQVPPEDVLIQGEPYAIERIGLDDLEEADDSTLSRRLEEIERSLKEYKKALEAQ